MMIIGFHVAEDVAEDVVMKILIEIATVQDVDDGGQPDQPG